MKTFINIWEDNGQVVIRSKQGIEYVDYEWYFCLKLSDARKKDVKKILLDLKKSKKITRFEKQGEWLKIYCEYLRRDQVVANITSLNVQTYEADLRLWQRYLTDEDIELDTDQSVLYFDIETDDTHKPISPGDDRITAIAAIGSDGKRYQLFSVTDEKKLLKKFVRLTDRYDILAGWNSEGFDLVAIVKRCKIYNIKIGAWATEWSDKDMGGLDNVRKFGKYRARPQTFNHIDLMMKVKEMHYRDTELIKKVRSFSLEAVSQAMLGEGKLDRDKGKVSTFTLARENPEFFKKYNMQDVELLVKLDKKLNIIQQKIIEHQVCNARINDYTSHGKIDPFALRAARKLGKHFPSKPDKKDEEEFKDIDPDVAEDSDRGVKKRGDYIGGYVFDPVKGIHNDVYIFDFQSLYPSIIKTFNVSLDTFVGKGKDTDTDGQLITMPSGAKFKRNETGIIPNIIQFVLDERNKIRFEVMKKLEKDSPEYWNWHYRQYAFKVLANSMYGIMGATFSRYFHRDLAEGITLTGQYLLKTMDKWMRDRGHEPIYGDSDSLFVKFGFEDDIEQMNEDMKAFIKKDLKKFNIKECHLQMDFEKKYDRFIMVAKKKYIGVAADGSSKISGLEIKKRDTLPRAEKLQRMVLDSLLKTDRPAKAYKKLIEKWKTKVYSGKLKKEEITYQKRLSRETTGYGKTMKDKQGGIKYKKDGTERKTPIPIWVQVAMEMKKKGADLGAGHYIPYIITESKDGLKAINAEDFDGHYDKDYYWKAIFSPTQRILEVCFPKVDWDTLGKKEQTLW